MKVSYLSEKGSGTINEDDLLVMKDLFGVFDGATGLGKAKGAGRTAARIAKKTFHEGEGTLKDMAMRANSKIKAARSVSHSVKEFFPATTAVVVKVGGRHADFLAIGDSLGLAIYSDGSHQPLAPYLDQDVGNLRKCKKLAAAGVKGIREQLEADIRKVRRLANVKYGLLNGEARAEKFITCGSLRLDRIASIVIFTDGFFIPKEDPDAPEDWDHFVRLYQEGGLKHILNHIRRLERSDPYFSRYPRFKKHDDASAIGIDFKD